jgi:predicted MFS family arabinose efflux permease
MSTQTYCTVDTNELHHDENDATLNDSCSAPGSNGDASIVRCHRPDEEDSMHQTSRNFYDQPMSAQQQFPQQQQQRRQRRWAVLLLFVCVVLVFADQNLMAPNLSRIATEFGFNPIERDQKLGGDIALAFFLLGAPASFLIGLLADHYNRIYIFTATMICGEGACLLTYFITTYRQLYLCRAVTGLSVGGILPLTYSLLGDMFAAEDRHTASSYVGTGMGFGISLGQGIAGLLGPIFGWRIPFLVVSIPAIVCALVLLLSVRDPERGGMEEAVRNPQFQFADIRSYGDHNDVDYNPPPLQGRGSDESFVEMSPLDRRNDSNNNISLQNSDNDVVFIESRYRKIQELWSTFSSLLSKPTLLLALLQGAPGCVPWGIVNTYLNDFLQVDRNMTGQYATLVVLIFGIGNFIGMLIGGYGGAYLYRIDKRYPALLAGLAAIASCFPFWILLNSVNSETSIWIIGSVSICTGVNSGITGPIIKATVQNVTLPNTRGQAFALLNTFDDMGRGLGPVFVASMIVRFGGRTQAFNIGVLGWIVCGIANLCVFFTVYNDELIVQSTITSNLNHTTVATSDDSHE